MKVLIVDDIQTNRKLLRTQLESEGLTVFEAADGVQGLAILERERTDAVISDVLMPNMDGFRFCLEVRKKLSLNHLAFIIYTSTYDSPTDRQLAQTVGADRYVIKPASAAMMLETLRETTQQRAASQGGRVAKGDTTYVLKQYSEALVQKLEKRNLELTARNEALRQVERQLHIQATALECAANAIVITDRSGAIQWVNPAFTTLTGYAEQDVIGKTPRVLKSGKHELAFYRELWKTILSGQIWRGEFTNCRKDGSLFYDEHTITPVRSAGGEITHFIGILHDVTARKRSEEAISHRARLAALTAEVSLALTRGGPLPEILKRCAEALVSYLDAAFARIWTLDEATNTLELQASAGMYTHLNGPHGRVPVGKFKIGLIAQERKPHLTNSVVGDPRVNDQNWAKREGMVAFAGYPLLVEDRVVGVMALFARRPLLVATLRALGSVADGIALGIERKRTEDALRSTHAQLSRVLEHSPAVNYALKLEGQCIVPYVVSENIERLLGFEVKDTMRYEWWLGQLHPDDRERVLATFSEGVRKGGYRVEYRIRHKDGSYRWIEDNNRMVRDHTGKATEAVGVWTDITDRKLAEEGLRESEEKFRQLAENTNEVFWITDSPKNRMLYISPGYERIWGRTCESLYDAPQTWLDAIHPDDRERVLRAALTKQVAGEYDEVYRITRADGSVRWIHDRAFPVRNAGGEVYRVVGTAEDITRQKQGEQRLAAQHAVTQALAEASTLGDAARKTLQAVCQALKWDVGSLWTLDQSSRCLRCVEIWHPPSTEFHEFVEFSRRTAFNVGEDLPGRVWEGGESTWIPDLNREPNFPRNALATRIGLRSAIAFPIRLEKETIGVLEFFSARIRSPEDELLALFFTIGSQIGEFIRRKQLEEQFRQSQKMEAFGQLAGGVAHDFNNILAVIMGYTSLLVESEALTDEVKDQLKQVFSAGERAANLTRQLLTFSRKKEMEAHPLDLNEVIGNMTKMLGRIIGEDIKLQCNYASSLPSIRADEGMMEQVLMNLAVNARDAMPKGGRLVIGTVRVVMDEARVSANREARVGEYVCLSLQDTGCGMTPEIKARIFEPFFTTKDVGKGTGLGLATVFGIVKQHDGWIEVESKVGVGTTFRVFLPAILQQEAAAERPGARQQIRGGNETILLVEDEVALRSLTKIVLQRYGYQVLEAGTGVEAVAVWEKDGPRIDLLITDMVMPEGMTGRELAKKLQAARPSLKVIYVSGYSLESEGTSFRVREASAFLQKPYHPQKLVETVRDVLDASH